MPFFKNLAFGYKIFEMDLIFWGYRVTSRALVVLILIDTELMHGFFLLLASHTHDKVKYWCFPFLVILNDLWIVNILSNYYVIRSPKALW